MIASIGLELAERAWIPDAAIRAGIRRLCRRREADLPGADAREAWIENHLDEMHKGPVANVPEAANEQHYEVPADFFKHCLGPRLKYSSCLFEKASTLEEAEIEALESTCAHADLSDGQDILELGCGWGSLTLWMAEHYPSSNITAVSNSHGQRAHIEEECRRRDLTNVRIITADMNEFNTSEQFDRLVSIEMFEHMHNWNQLFQRARSWMHDQSSMLIHVFCHKDTPYFFEDKGTGDWMARHFFSGGQMPSLDLPGRLGEHLQLEQMWQWNGEHYARTAEAWLDELDRNQQAARAALMTGRPGVDPRREVQRWRMFFMACAELFGLDNGKTWLVGHFKLTPSA